MTKFILHGGKTTIESQNNSRFFHEMTKGLKEPVNVLCLYFARDEKLWKKLFTQDKTKFRKNAKQKNIRFVLADKSLTKLIKQMTDADVIYMRGGRTGGLHRVLRDVPNLSQLLVGKVVSGSSAGAYVLSRYYYSNTREIIDEGLDILPIKIFCHYEKVKQEKLNLLEQHRENLPTYKIPITEFVVLKKQIRFQKAATPSPEVGQ